MTVRSIAHGLVDRMMQSPFASRLLASLLWDAPKLKKVRLHGKSFRLSVESSFINRQFIPAAGVCSKFEQKEGKTLDFISRNLRRGDVFWDIGANVGCYVAYAAACEELSSIVALEPEALNHAALCKTIHANDLRNVVALCCGAWEEDMYTDFFLQNFLAGNHSGRTRDYRNGKGIESSSRFVGGYTQKIHLVQVDRLIASAGLAVPNLLLMDIDGGETGAMRGMRQTLADPRLRAVVVEVDDATVTEVDALLTASGLMQVDEERSQGRRNVFYNRVSEDTLR